MPSSNITGLTALAVMQPDMLMYAALSPFGATDDRKITASDLLTTITPLDNNTAGLVVTNSAVPTVPQVVFTNAAGTSRMQIAMAGAATITDTFDEVSIFSSVAAKTLSLGLWNAIDSGEAAEIYLYAGAAGTVFLRARCVDSGGANTNLLDVPNSAVLESSNTASGGLILIADVGGGGAPIIFSTGGHTFASEKGRFDSAGFTLGKASSVTGALNLANSASANLTTIQAGNAAAARTYTWPTDFGAAGSVLTDAAGNGVLSWAAASAGGNTTSQGTASARPAAGTAGNLYFSTDAFQLSRDTGAAYSEWGPMFQFTPVVLGDFTAVNQGGATATQINGSVAVTAPVNSGDSLRIWKKSAPGSTPYQIDVAFLASFPALATFEAGPLWRQSSDGKLVIVGYATAPGAVTFVNKYTNPTTFSANAAGFNISAGWGNIFFFRIRDDGTNRQAFWSSDGQTWVGFYSETRTTFLTADEVGFFLNVNNTTFSGAFTLLGWKQS